MILGIVIILYNIIVQMWKKADKPYAPNLLFYEGNLPFIFVSYAHKDSREVFDLIEKLAARGYRIWYDEGIEPGSEWPENIANHLLRAEMVLAMITNDSMDSVNCRREINYAMSKGKPLLSVVLEKTEIPAGMELQLSSQQSVLRYNFTDENRFLDKIESCSYMDPCIPPRIFPTNRTLKMQSLQ